MKSITYTIGLTYQIEGFEHLCFGADKRLYNCKTGRVKKKSFNNGSVGYWLDSKTFKSLRKIKPLLRKIKTVKTPF